MIWFNAARYNIWSQVLLTVVEIIGWHWVIIHKPFARNIVWGKLTLCSHAMMYVTTNMCYFKSQISLIEVCHVCILKYILKFLINNLAHKQLMATGPICHNINESINDLFLNIYR